MSSFESLEQFVREYDFPASGNVSERVIEEYADLHECSYDEAYKHYGIDPNELEQTDIEPSLIGPSVNLSERATHLKNALHEYSESSKIGGFKYASENENSDIHKRYTNDQISRIISSSEWHRGEGYKEFAKAFGTVALINSGYDTDIIMDDTKVSEREFINKYVGKDNKSKRDKFREVLSKQEINN
ncbi:MAG: hypothetical protein WCJ36_00790 [Candidatus Saccharibacteria bacterium]